MTEVPYVVVDVFTEERFGGNQLAVVTDARGLSDHQMQRIANEFNYSESSFVLPPEDPANTARVRIFTRDREVPFAGHPNVGTAFALGRMETIFGVEPSGEMRFEEIAGLVDVELATETDEVVGATIKAPQALALGSTIEPGYVARCLGLEEDGIRLDRHPPRSMSVGLIFVVVEVTEAALEAARPDISAFRAAAADHAHLELGGRFSLFIHAASSSEPGLTRARMFAPLGGTIEDPATGSASAALGAFLGGLAPETDGDVVTRIAQGVEMGRPSRITVTARKAGGVVTDVAVSGRCMPVMRGELEA
jgi:trans-2,3-dihydro-3-hydroxyanthranilate isomerase